MALSPDALRSVEVADVYKGDQRAGVLRRLVDGVEFSYLPDYSAPLPPVATTLPITVRTLRTHAAGAVPAFFAGLLPEGRRLVALSRAVKASADDELTLLLAVGRSAIGDVRVVPSGEQPDEPRPQVSGDWQELRFADLLRDLAGGDRLDRIGLPGIQDKASVGVISLPVAGSPAPSILKLNPPELPHLVENEAFFLAAARSAGIAVAEARIVHDSVGEPGLLVSRFDRIERDGGTQMLAQEDGCQVLGRWPADKYRLTTEEVFGRLSALTGAPVVAARRLVQQLAFAFVTGNGDAHAKNFSVLRGASGEWAVSPAYDLPSTYPYGDATLALSVGGSDRANLTRGRFVELGGVLGLRERAVHTLLDEVLASVPTWLPGLEGLPFDERRLHKLRRTIVDRTGLLERRA